MATVDETLKGALEIEGAIAAALVDYESGMCLGSVGGGTLDLEIAAAGNTDVVRAELRTLQRLGWTTSPRTSSPPSARSST